MQSPPRILLCYIRKSIIDGPTASPARQKSAIERSLAAQGYDLRWYDDLDISGRFEANRPGWQALLADLDRPGVAGVAVESFDRSHRNLAEFLAFYDQQLQPRGLALISATQNINLATAEGRAMASVVMAFNEFESRVAGERMAATIRHKKINEGRHWGGHYPFGCDRRPETKHLVSTALSYFLNPSTGQALARIDEQDPPPGFEIRYYHDALRALFDLYATGTYSATETASVMNASGWRCWGKKRENPQPFNRGTVRSIVQRWEIYAGRLVSPTTPNDYYRNLPAMDGGHDPILPVELCEAVGRAYKARSIIRDPRQPGRGDYVYLLSGLLFCVECGQRLGGQRCGECRVKNYYLHSYRKPADCSQKFQQAPALERQVLDALLEIIDQGPILEDVAAEIRAILHEAELERIGQRSPLVRLEAKRGELERLIDLHVSGLITRPQFERRQASINGDIEALQAEVEGGPNGPMANVDSTIKRILGHVARLRSAEPATQKNILRSFFKRIETGGGKIVRVEPHTWLEPFLLILGDTPLHVILKSVKGKEAVYT